MFGYDNSIWSVHVKDSGVQLLVAANTRSGEGKPFRFLYGFHADVSPIDDQIVYSSCEFATDKDSSAESDAVALERYIDPQRGKYNYEIALVDIAGINASRATENAWLDHFPVWHPDGSRIAYLANPSHGRSVYPYSQQLYTMAPDGSSIREIVGKVAGLQGVALAPPVWSPDGEYIAFYALRGERRPFAYVLYTVRLDGLELQEIAETQLLSTNDDRLPLPTWAPDGKQLAFFMGSDAIATARPDGSGLRQLASDAISRKLRDWKTGLGRNIATDAASRQLHWAPDGEEILFFAADQLYSIRLGGGGDGLSDARADPMRQWLVPDALRIRMSHASGPTQVAWAPDGSQIAIHYPGQLLATIGRDGTEHRILLEGDVRVAWRAQTDDQRGQPVDVSACSAGLVVPEPEQNPGLVLDCKTLLRSMEVLAGDADFRWRTDEPITRWVGLDFTVSPYRVRDVELKNLGLAGTIPLELLNLGELISIDLLGNPLSGCIPPELWESARVFTGSIQGQTLTGMLDLCRSAGAPGQ